jgi:hypothetical protein
MAQLVDRFLVDPTRSAGAKADGDYRVILRLLDEFGPTDTPVQAVTRDHCRQVAALLKRMPANAGKKPQFRGRSPLDAAAEAERLGVPSMSPATANSYIAKMSALFRWAAREAQAQFAAHAQRRPQVTGLPDRLPPALFLHSDRPKLFHAGA